MLTRGFSQSINEDMIFKIAIDKSEINKIAAFNVEIHNEPLENYIISLFTQDPLRDENYWLYIEDTSTGEIISSLALLSNYWSFAGLELKIAEMGFVGTLTKHRGKGLYKILNTFYEKLMKQENLFVSVLRGIPHFYSKYGYGFSLPTEKGYCIKTDQIEFVQPNKELLIRIAIDSDFVHIEDEYNKIFEYTFISSTFKLENFKYRFNSSKLNDNFGITYIVEKFEKIIGFFTMVPSFDYSTSRIFLISDMEKAVVTHILHYIKETFEISDKICLNISDSMRVYVKLSELELIPMKGWKWQIKITNLGNLISSFIPILQERLSRSTFSDLTETFSISNYKEVVYFQIHQGNVKIIESKKEWPDHRCTIRVPSNYLPMFIFGDKSYSEIKNIVPDIMITAKYIELMNVLFPKLESFPIYRY
ncbi:MAG: hypothetical protein HeimC2_41950 [Candidatus Heimdallarchaeota archaeon LC_2]|nr:MAG: hypothetical protein HeimC2_41950 [Candidatus Heimdallarchaeota archaeon LC_2]